MMKSDKTTGGGVEQFKITYMPCHGYLGVHDCFVGNTGIVGVYLIALAVEVTPQFTVEEQHRF